MTGLILSPARTAAACLPADMSLLLLAGAIFQRGRWDVSGTSTSSSTTTATNKAVQTRVPNPSKDSDVWMMLRKRWFSLPQVFRYFVSGNVANVALFFLERGVRYSIKALFVDPLPNGDSISYFLAYLLHIVVQHGLHALLVYGYDSINTRSKYLTTLLGTYQALFVSAIGSTILNTYLIQLGCDRDLSFVITLLVFSCLNYLWISYVVKQANTPDVGTEQAATKKRRHVGTVFQKIRGGQIQLQWDACFGSLSFLHTVPTPC